MWVSKFADDIAYIFNMQEENESINLNNATGSILILKHGSTKWDESMEYHKASSTTDLARIATDSNW